MIKDGERVYAILEFSDGRKTLLEGESYGGHGMYTSKVHLKNLRFIRNSESSMIINEEKDGWKLRDKNGWEPFDFATILGTDISSTYNFQNDEEAILAYEVI